MKYEQPRFQTGNNSKAYKDSWDRMFGDEVEPEPQVEELEIWVVEEESLEPDCYVRYDYDVVAAFMTKEAAEAWVETATPTHPDHTGWNILSITLHV